MSCYRLTAPRQLGKVPKGYSLMVPSRCTGSPDSQEVRQALINAGFTDPDSLSYRSYGNWKVEKLS